MLKKRDLECEFVNLECSLEVAMEVMGVVSHATSSPLLSSSNAISNVG